MASLSLSAPPRLRGSISVPGDRSIGVRAVLFNAIAEGNARIKGFWQHDLGALLTCLTPLGVRFDGVPEQKLLRVYGRGLRGLRRPDGALAPYESSTATHLLAGLLAGQPFSCTFSSSEFWRNIRNGPQHSSIEWLAGIIPPLREIGAQLEQPDPGNLVIHGQTLHGGSYDLTPTTASAKSALLLAQLNADGPFSLGGHTGTHDHTERMLQAMAVDLTLEQGRLVLYPPAHPVFPYPLSLTVPGDPSLAAYWWVAAAIHPDAELTTPYICLNPTRGALLAALKAMGAKLEVYSLGEEGGEPIGDVTVRSSTLRGITLDASRRPSRPDELAVLLVAAACAEGETSVATTGLAPTTVDNMRLLARELGQLGAAITIQQDHLTIAGAGELRGTELHGAAPESWPPGPVAKALRIASLVVKGTIKFSRGDVDGLSYPDFEQHFERIKEGL